MTAPKGYFMWYVYIIECNDGQLYTGMTQDLERRLREHTHRGSHFTSYNPLKSLLYSETHPTEEQAKAREGQIKRWSRAKKLALARGDFNSLHQLSKSRD